MGLNLNIKKTKLMITEITTSFRNDSEDTEGVNSFCLESSTLNKLVVENHTMD